VEAESESSFSNTQALPGQRAPPPPNIPKTKGKAVLFATHLQINIRNNYRTYPIVVRQMDTIEEVKRQIQNEYPDLGLPQTLVWAGRELESNRKIADYNMADGTRMSVILSDRTRIQPWQQTSGNSFGVAIAPLPSPPTPPRDSPTPKQIQPRQQTSSNSWGVTLVDLASPGRLPSPQPVPQNSFARRPVHEQPTAAPTNGWKLKSAATKHQTSAPTASFKTKLVASAEPTGEKLSTLLSSALCEACGEVLPSVNGLKKHRRRVHGFRGDFFPGKNTALPPATSVLVASAESTREKLSTLLSGALCEACGEVLPSVNSLKKHRRRVHGFKGDFFPGKDTALPPATSTAQNPPPRALSRSLELQRLVPEPPSQFNDGIRTQCRVCGDIFHSKNSFKRHRRRGKRGNHQCEAAEPLEVQGGASPFRENSTGKKRWMRIFIRIPTGRKASRQISLDVLPSFRIDKLKEILLDKQGIPLENQWLIYGGQELDNRRTLADYYIESGDLLTLSIRTKWGGILSWL
jgi:ubiquitin-large subunit ribosomal protein L40e